MINEEQILICGGGLSGATNKCFELGSSTSEILMQQSRKFAASVEYQGGLWVTGGQNEAGQALSSTEMIKNGQASPGPDLPSEFR